MAIYAVEAVDASSSQSPAPTGSHQHHIADAVANSSPRFARFGSAGLKKLPANDALLAQENLSPILEPPIT